MNEIDNDSQLEIIRTERDAYQQELFESNRYNSDLVIERQSLYNRILETQRYIAELERLMTEREDARYDLERRQDAYLGTERYVAELERFLSEREDARFELECRLEKTIETESNRKLFTFRRKAGPK